MNRIELYVYGRIEEIKLEVEAMKWDNEIRKMQGSDAFNYYPEHFEMKAREIRLVIDKLCVEKEF